MFETLDQLPEPDLIIASPPCESWSVASSMFNGNASWKKGTCYALGETSFIPRGRREYKMKSASGREVQFKFKRSFLQRINGELTAFNTIRIIARYKPKVFVIENPKLSRIWKYIDVLLNNAAKCFEELDATLCAVSSPEGIVIYDLESIRALDPQLPPTK